MCRNINACSHYRRLIGGGGAEKEAGREKLQCNAMRYYVTIFIRARTGCCSYVNVIGEMIMNECARLEDLYLAEWRVGKKDRKSGAIVTWNHKFCAKL